MYVGDPSCAKMKGCQFGDNYHNSVFTGPITLKLRMHVGFRHACVTVGVLLHVRRCKATIVPDLENG